MPQLTRISESVEPVFNKNEFLEFTLKPESLLERKRVMRR
jgi:hypothetical protein